jgi:L-histidine N-alpha-methyltransferase
LSESSARRQAAPDRPSPRGRLTLVHLDSAVAPRRGSEEAGRRAEFARHVRSGLTATPKQLHSRYLYDEEGSRLFEQICDLPEYYLTRAEHEILERYAGDIVAAIPGCETLVELGSGSAVKSRILIGALLDHSPGLRYIPVDISSEILEEASLGLLSDFPKLSVTALAAEYEEGLRVLPGLTSASAEIPAPHDGNGSGAGNGHGTDALAFAGREKCEAKNAAPASSPATPPKLVLWLGSNIGNLHREEAAGFLSRIAAILTPRDALLVGIDRRKSRAVLEPAYDDAAGVTVRFNLNLLTRINRELGGTFDRTGFQHSSRYNEIAGRIETHLVSRRDQSVFLRGAGEPGYPLTVRFAAGERIHTENSYKYSDAEIAALAAASGLVIERQFQDSAGLFSDVLFRRAPASR